MLYTHCSIFDSFVMYKKMRQGEYPQRISVQSIKIFQECQHTIFHRAPLAFLAENRYPISAYAFGLRQTSLYNYSIISLFTSIESTYAYRTYTIASRLGNSLWGIPHAMD